MIPDAGKELEPLLPRRLGGEDPAPGGKHPNVGCLRSSEVEDEEGERDREGPQEEELTTSQPRESGEKNPSQARSKRRHHGCS